MEIIGEHDNGLLDNAICKLIIKNGLLGIYTTNNTNYSELNQPLDDSEWNFRKINWKENKPVVPINTDIQNIKTKSKFSHVIEYKIKNNDTQRIFINPNKRQKFQLKKNKGQLFYQKLTPLEYVSGAIIAFAINIFASYTYDCITSNKDIAPITQRKSNTINHPINTNGSTFNSTHDTIKVSTIKSENHSLIRSQNDK